MDFLGSIKKAEEKRHDLYQKEKDKWDNLADKEADFENKKFQSSAFGGIEEAESLIEQYSKTVEMTNEQMEALRQNVPARADFDVITREQYEEKTFIGQYKYNRKVKKYFKKRKEFYKEVKKAKNLKDLSEKAKKANVFGKTLMDLNRRVDLNKKADEYRKQGIFKDVEETSEAMDAAYEMEGSNTAFMDAELDMAYQESVALQQKSAKGHQALWDYAAETHVCTAYNNYLRFGEDSHRVANVAQKTKDGTDAIASNKLNRDLVVRRGVKGVRTVAHMLGLENAEGLSQNEIQRELEDRLYSGDETIMTDKGFVSTSLPFSQKSYPAEGGGGDSVGVEFIILAKKGTEAVNMIPISKWKKETEILLKPGTKFKLVDVKFGGDVVTCGSKESWKVYLTTVPEKEDGILREAS